MQDTNLTSAREVVPIILSYIKPDSIVDVGCGVGLWLKAFAEHGVKNINGFDGSWVTEEMLAIPTEAFAVVDFEQNIHIDKKADMAVSLEVAEHVSEKQADEFVSALVQTAPVVVFSAAIPLQGGSRHINEQWPEYWEEKFASHGYVAVDCIRRKVWSNKKVSFFYAQNMFFFVKKDMISHYPKLEKEYNDGNNRALSMVHPNMYLYYAERWRTIVPFLGKIPVPVLHGVKKLLRKIKGN